MQKKIAKYVRTWKGRGYADDLPDTVPDRLMQLGLAPSYKAIAIAILKNDHSMQSLGFTPIKSPVYMAIKKLEIEARGKT